MAADILIVDDEDDIRGLVAGILEDEGHGARLARDSDEAIAAIEARRPSARESMRPRAGSRTVSNTINPMTTPGNPSATNDARHPWLLATAPATSAPSQAPSGAPSAKIVNAGQASSRKHAKAVTNQPGFAR